MRVSEIITDMLKMVDGLDLSAPGTLAKKSQEYANAPHEVTQPVATIIAQGDDVNKPKHPSDIRADSISMYPNYQAKE